MAASCTVREYVCRCRWLDVPTPFSIRSEAFMEYRLRPVDGLRFILMSAHPCSFLSVRILGKRLASAVITLLETLTLIHTIEQFRWEMFFKLPLFQTSDYVTVAKRQLVIFIVAVVCDI